MVSPSSAKYTLSPGPKSIFSSWRLPPRLRQSPRFPCAIRNSRLVTTAWVRLSLRAVNHSSKGHRPFSVMYFLMLLGRASISFDCHLKGTLCQMVFSQARIGVDHQKKYSKILRFFGPNGHFRLRHAILYMYGVVIFGANS